jgi:hypothetical protein
MELDEKLCDHRNIILGKVCHIDASIGEESSEVEIVIYPLDDLGNCIALVVAVHLQTVERLLKYPALIEILIVDGSDDTILGFLYDNEVLTTIVIFAD